MHKVTIGDWSVDIEVGSLPATYDWLTENALLVDEIDIKAREGRPLFLAVYGPTPTQRETWTPILVVAQTYSPSVAGFNPGFLIAPETKKLFLGAGTRLLSYDLTKPSRLWENETECGFWRWGRHRNLVWMAAELEFAVWSATGDKLWSAFVEPPWEYSFTEDTVELDVMGRKQVRQIFNGEVISRPDV